MILFLRQDKEDQRKLGENNGEQPKRQTESILSKGQNNQLKINVLIQCQLKTRRDCSLC